MIPLLETEPTFWVITEAQDKEATIEAVKRSQANILLLDLSMVQQPHFDLGSHLFKGKSCYPSPYAGSR